MGVGPQAAGRGHVHVATEYVPLHCAFAIAFINRIMTTPSRSVVLSPTRRSPRLLHRQLAGSKRRSSDTDHPDVNQQPPSKVPRVSPQSLSLAFLLNSVSSDADIISKLQLTRCTDSTGCKQLLVVTSKRLHRHEPAGFVSRLRIVVNEDQSYQLQVMLNTFLM